MPEIAQRPEHALTREPAQFISTSATDATAVQALNDIFTTAAYEGVSDIHFENRAFNGLVRFRYNGDLRDIGEYPQREFREFEKQLRMKCRLSLVERMKALDGTFRFEAQTKAKERRVVDVRLSLLPTADGVSIVCRLLDQSANLRRLEELRMSPALEAEIRAGIAKPQGLFLVSGPTGSGKTTTLYSMLQILNRKEAKVLTIEDPVEYRLPGIVQSQVTEHLTFADALRSFLRQDPDVILVGEIRDGDTARIAVQAALTGHIVLSTIHANSATVIFNRLYDLGVDGNALAAAAGGMLAQRLLRVLCDHCKTPHPVDDTLRAGLVRLGLPPEQAAQVSVIYEQDNAGCEHCVRGWKGRLPIYEYITPTRAMRLAIQEGDIARITTLSERQEQYTTLAQAAMAAVASGETSLSEAVAVAAT